MSNDALRFYYLRLMSRKQSEEEVHDVKITQPKFVRWSDSSNMPGTLEEDPELESQAMRIVRTIGQAFEVCHKLNLEKDLSEESAEQKAEEEPTPSTSSKPLISLSKSDSNPSANVEPVIQTQRSQSAKSAEIARPMNSFAGKTQAPSSVPRRRFVSLTGNGLPLRNPEPGVSAADSANANVSVMQECSSDQTVISTSTSNIPVKLQSTAQQVSFSPVPVPFPQPPPPPPQQQQPVPTPVPATKTTNVTPGEGGLNVSNFPGLLPLQHSLSQSRTWGAGQPLISPYATMTKDSNELYGALSPTSSTRGIFPYSISSPQMLPCGNIPFQQYYANPSGYLSPERMISPVQPTAEQGIQSNKTATVNQAYDSYNLNLLRGQLDQAQQQAQIAVAQVQLLREHLSAETTARLESQNRTQQLFLANKELIEQVQALVSRLQQLEAHVAVSQSADSSIPASQPSTSVQVPRQQPPPDRAQLRATPSAMQRKVQETVFHVQQLQKLQNDNTNDVRTGRFSSLPSPEQNPASLFPQSSMTPTPTKSFSESGEAETSSYAGLSGNETSGGTTSDTATSDYSSSELDITNKYTAAVAAVVQQYARQAEELQSPHGYGDARKELSVFTAPDTGRLSEMDRFNYQPSSLLDEDSLTGDGGEAALHSVTTSTVDDQVDICDINRPASSRSGTITAIVKRGAARRESPAELADDLSSFDSPQASFHRSNSVITVKENPLSFGGDLQASSLTEKSDTAFDQSVKQLKTVLQSHCGDERVLPSFNDLQPPENELTTAGPDAGTTSRTALAPSPFPFTNSSTRRPLENHMPHSVTGELTTAAVTTMTKTKTAATGAASGKDSDDHQRPRLTPNPKKRLLPPSVSQLLPEGYLRGNSSASKSTFTDVGEPGNIRR